MHDKLDFEGESAGAGQEHVSNIMEMNLPNKLTISRVAMVPVFVALLSFDHVACLSE